MENSSQSEGEGAPICDWHLEWGAEQTCGTGPSACGVCSNAVVHFIIEL